jgi:mono/diheme cytochrome c family protein
LKAPFAPHFHPEDSMKIIGPILLGLSVFCFGACSGTSARISTIEVLTPSTTDGATLYASNCASCHGTDARTGTVHRNIVATATGNTSSAIDTVLAGNGDMPSFSGLTDQQIADILGYIKTL